MIVIFALKALSLIVMFTIAILTLWGTAEFFCAKSLDGTALIWAQLLMTIFFVALILPAAYASKYILVNHWSGGIVFQEHVKLGAK